MGEMTSSPTGPLSSACVSRIGMRSFFPIPPWWSPKKGKNISQKKSTPSKLGNFGPRAASLGKSAQVGLNRKCVPQNGQAGQRSVGASELGNPFSSSVAPERLWLAGSENSSCVESFANRFSSAYISYVLDYRRKRDLEKPSTQTEKNTLYTVNPGQFTI
jgi:hypothetical protein